MKKRLLIPFALLIIFIPFSCTQKEKQASSPENVINVQLSDEEKAGGVMTPEIMWKFSRLGSFALSPDGKELLYTTTRIDLQTEKRITDIYRITSSGGTPVQLTSGGGASPQWIDGGKRIVFTKGGSLWSMSPAGDEMKEITGLKDFETFSISPSGDRLYFTRRVKLDQTANEKHKLEKPKVRIIDDLMYRHWNYWHDYSYSHLFVAKFNGTQVSEEKDIMEGQRFETPTSPYFDEGEICWSPDGRYIAYTSKRVSGTADARSTNSDIFLYDTGTGKEINITVGNKGYDKYPVFSPDGSMIAYQSMERDGFEADLDRLFVYSMGDGKREWITKKWDYDVESLTWADNTTIFFASDFRGTKQIFKTTIGSGDVTKVTEGIHDLGPLNLKSGVMVAQIVSMSMAPELCSIDPLSGSVSKISDINGYIYSHIKMGRVEEKYVRTKDNQDLQNWVIFPPDFDPSKKYPLLLFCKGGPQGPLGQSWSYRWNYQMMAAKGYIVLAVNRRGNSGFGQAWKEQISGDWGGRNIQDYLDATDAMAKEPYIDSKRMGAVGASYGGFSVFYLAGVHQGRFRAFVSHAGVFNFISEYGSTEELWFPDFDYGGPYWEDHPSYKFSPHLMVENWDTPILIITGANDFRIPYTQSLEAFTAAKVRGVPARLLFFEDEYHWVTRPQNSVVWQREYFEWLDAWLK